MERRSFLKGLCAAALAGYLRVVPDFAQPRISAADRFGVDGPNILVARATIYRDGFCVMEYPDVRRGMDEAMRAFAKFRDEKLVEVLS